MRSLPQPFLFVALILLAGGQLAGGDTLSDPSGFSFTYPDGWVAVNRESIGDVRQKVSEETKGWVSSNVDFSRLTAILVRDSDDEFRDNLNVVVDPRQLPLTDQNRIQVTRAIAEEYGKMGVKLDDVQSRIQKVGERDALVLEYQIALPNVPDVLRQRQVMFPGGGKTYVVTCTSRASTFDLYRPVFDEVLASFQVPAPVKTGFDWKRAVWMGVVGGALGGLAGALGWFKTRQQSGKASPPPSTTGVAGERGPTSDGGAA